ncbi:MAG: amino acid adenylation domain-containing protein [Chroococcidiopsidaceae cyanobacterium CP_BM_ER_R8_30]|nr:amino acid adenylation domain-containing protein [Chroococcidiopsidaceae cyanobacterium CP_BM_ER_R8_30]
MSTTIDVELVNNVAYQKVLGEGNDVRIDFSQPTCIHQIFEAQVERTPNAVAVVFEDTKLTYRQLNQRANQLAHHLRYKGVGHEVLVGICMERSLEMVIGLLGILKAGGAYVPLDPAYPLERLAFILQETQVRVLLTQEQLVEHLPAHKAQLICLDSDWELIGQKSRANLICETTASSLAYTIYTSGSTGQPKGVMIAHHGICNQLYWRQTTFSLTAADRVLQTISLSFDPSVWQIFWPLSFGAQLYLARPGGQRDSAYLVKLIAQQQITVIALVPSMLRLFLQEKDLDTCKCLKHVSCGGEPLPSELIERFFARLNLDNVLHNVYGPTEASIDATFWTCSRNTHHRIAPIGRPIANTQIYLLDSQLQTVPLGTAGEIHIGGVGLALGYFNRPELTAEKFIRNPFSNDLGARLYKTGDLARYLPDGKIEFLGRIDYQVKIRGFRIELEEIEAAISQHPDVRQSVVVVREDIPGAQRLVAYIVLSQARVFTVGVLRRFLQEKLPEYMLPSACVVLETLPLTPNGKIDRRALPVPSQPHALESAFVAPQNPLEFQLKEIWEQVLGIQPIGVKNNFFELGGNSLQAVRLMTQIEEIFNKKLPLVTFFQAPTVEQLANVLQQEGWIASWEPLVAIQPRGNKLPFFCIHCVGGNVFSFYKLAHYLGEEQPFYGLQARGLDGEQSPHTRIEEMAADYIQEIQTLQPEGPYFLGGYSFGGLVAYEVAQQLHAQGQTVAMLVLFDTHNANSFKPFPIHVRASRHLINFLQLEPKEKLVYIKEQLDCIFQSDNQHKSALQNPLLTAHTQAFRNYIPQIFPGRAILFRASNSSKGDLHLLQFGKFDPQLGWGRLIAGGLEIQDVPGDHISMLEEPHVNVLAHKLENCLDLSQKPRAN